MKLIKKILIKIKIIGELFHFLWERKLWWLIPFVSILIILGILFIIAQSSSVGPFIYTLF